MANVRLENVYKIYPNGVLAVKDFNLNIENEEFVVFVGPSGCGKSTTLRMIAGLEEISAGRVYIDDVLVNDLEPKDRDISMVFQNYALYPNMTVYDNMAYGLRCQPFNYEPEFNFKVFELVSLIIKMIIKYHLRRKEKERVIKEKITQVAEILGITDYLNRKPKELSGGQRQRVALGRAIVRNPKVFLLDEPLSNLDAKLRVQMRSEITKLHDKLGTTFIYVTHDQVEAMTMGTRIVVMKDGIVQQVDTPLNLFNHPKNTFVATFLGSPQMNLLCGTIKCKQDKYYFENDNLSVLINDNVLKKINEIKDDQKVYLGIRPKDVRLSDNGFKTTIELIEQLGSETILYFNLPGKEGYSTLTISDSKAFRIGDEITVSFDEDKIHLFDRETNETLFNYEESNSNLKKETTSHGYDLEALPYAMYKKVKQSIVLTPLEIVNDKQKKKNLNLKNTMFKVIEREIVNNRLVLKLQGVKTVRKKEQNTVDLEDKKIRNKYYDEIVTLVTDVNDIFTDQFVFVE